MTKDIPYQYLEYFLEDDEELKRIHDDYEAGRMLSGEWDADAYYETKDFIEEVAIDSDWKKFRGKHYCPDCYRYGDNDELILRDGVVIMPEEDDWE